jgi:hypothetical protein
MAQTTNLSLSTSFLFSNGRVEAGTNLATRQLVGGQVPHRRDGYYFRLSGAVASR